MTTVSISLMGQISYDFVQACGELAQARRRQRLKDSTANRAAVTEWQDKVNAVLDMFLETQRDWTVEHHPPMTVPASATLATPAYETLPIR